MISITIAEGKKAYFVSDHHFGAYSLKDTHQRERHFVNWINSIENHCDTLFILGDFIDFWVEYKKVVPKGFVRSFGKLSDLTDKGINIYYFLGNHDLWAKDYFSKELGITILEGSHEVSINEKVFLLGHGDGLGNASKFYKTIKKVYTNKYLQFLLRWTHPDIGISLGQYLSRKQKDKHSSDENVEKERDILLEYSKTQEILDKGYDYIIFGHQHDPKQEKLNKKTTYFNSGDWIQYNTYIEFDKGQCILKSYKKL